MNRSYGRACLFALLLTAATLTNASDAERNWAQWRGPLSTGVAPLADPPVEWSETKNIHWKIEVPGKGHSTPVVWGDRIFLTTAVAYGEPVLPPAGTRAGAHDNLQKVNGQDFMVLAINRADGKILWQQKVAREIPHEGGHETGSFASHSPVTDGENVYAYFGSEGLYCLNAKDGALKWKASFGQMHSLHGHGEGNSPALAGDTILINWDQQGPSFLVALDKNGKRTLARQTGRSVILVNAHCCGSFGEKAGHRERHQSHSWLRSGNRH